MESNLRPLTLGEILDRTAQLYRTNFLVFSGIFAVYAGAHTGAGPVADWPRRTAQSSACGWSRMYG